MVEPLLSFLVYILVKQQYVSYLTTKYCIEFLPCAGNYSSSSAGQDVQRFMRLLCCNCLDFFQCCNLWILGLRQSGSGEQYSPFKFNGQGKAFAANLVSLDHQCFHPSANCSCHGGKSNSRLFMPHLDVEILSTHSVS